MVLCMETNTHFLSDLSQSFSEREMLQKNVVEKVKTQILYLITFFLPKSCRLCDNVENILEWGRPHDNMAHVHCMLDN